MQAVTPHAVICPLQLALSVQLDHHFCSRFLIDTINALGYSSSYSEIQLFKRSAAACKDDSFDEMVENQLVQHVADNVDHDICTLDGKFTFHGMGMLAAVTPSLLLKRKRVIPRVKVTIEDIKGIGRVALHTLGMQVQLLLRSCM